ncbi:MAG TPA: hypothetical protein VHU84_04015 [Lacipirellulaceae bacterium]|nr:hypothetical protein [Lacipirellulaceae bacterium]
MKFYKYWARGEAKVQERRPWTLRAYGGSNRDLDQAIRRANEIAARAASAIQEGRSPEKYGYADRSLREEIVQEIHDSRGLSAVITRNSYGALVLNTSRVMFADVDYPPPPGVLSLVKNIWDRIRGKPTATLPDRDEQLLRRFREVVDSQPGLGLRIYRTAAGYRLLATSDTYDPRWRRRRTHYSLCSAATPSTFGYASCKNASVPASRQNTGAAAWLVLRHDCRGQTRKRSDVTDSGKSRITQRRISLRFANW